MTEKIGLIKNPLTIIAIFAGIAEVSGTVVLPFVSEVNQQIFIYFLVCFPCLLVLLFFITLNFNNKALYAPSDYQDETNYIKINKFDISKQKTVEVKIPKEDSKNQFQLQVTERIEALSSHILRLEASMTQQNTTVGEEILEHKIDEYSFLVSNFRDADKFISQMRMDRIDFKVYRSYSTDGFADLNGHQAVWLGKAIPLKLAQTVLGKSKAFYPHLRYVMLADDVDLKEDNQIYIGGSTNSAERMFKLKPLKDGDFNRLKEIGSLEGFHDFIKQFESPFTDDATGH
jgi:hypothetical protein